MLTSDDRRLIGDVIRWARKSGWRAVGRGGALRDRSYTWRHEHHPYDFTLTHVLDTGQPIASRWYTGGPNEGFEDQAPLTLNLKLDVRMAIDLLVAYRWLPGFFSSAFVQAWADGHEAGSAQGFDHAINDRLDTAYELIEAGGLVEQMTEKHCPDLLPDGFDRRYVLEQLACVVRDVIGEAVDRRGSRRTKTTVPGKTSPALATITGSTR